MNPQKRLVSVVTPAFNEGKNLSILHERLSKVLSALPETEYEWIVVDDHSTDDTFAVLERLHRADPRIRAFRLSRNSGSHVAVACGLEKARGECAIVLAADMQDPPEFLPEFLKERAKGAQVVWAARSGRGGAGSGLFASTYYFIMRRIVGIRGMPPRGADYFLVDRVVLDSLAGFTESHTNLLAAIASMGFRQVSIRYEKQERLHGASGWTLRKKLSMVFGSIVSFSSFPIRAMSYGGFLTLAAGVAMGAFCGVSALRGGRPEGWLWVVAAVLSVGGLQMILMGILGAYTWRALEESRRRPRYLIEATTETDGDRIAPGSVSAGDRRLKE